MSLLAAYTVPHPPLIIPAVGQGQEQGIAATTAAFQEVARRVAAYDPQTIVITSPHAPFYRDAFFVSDTPTEQGNMAMFRHPEEALSTKVDVPFVREIIHFVSRHSIPLAGSESVRGEIDHGTFVPLYFLAQEIDLEKVHVVRLGLSLLSDADHLFLGRAIAHAAEQLDRRTVLVASGDWSHKLTPDGPYGYVPEGPEFDAKLAQILSTGQLDELFHLDNHLCEEAAECGLRSFKIMAGALEGQVFTNELLSYEGPFGVGYGVAAFEIEQLPNSAKTGTEENHGSDTASAGYAPSSDTTEPAVLEQEPDPYVALARQSVETFVQTGRMMDIRQAAIAGEDLRTLESMHAGAFVSLHEHGELRGCIGTIAATRTNLAQEIIHNGVAACSEDPRFPPVRPDELDALEYSVDVLGQPEEVWSLEQLDPKHYGVIVSRGHRRGLLLPDLPGVDTVQDQIAIAKQKAGIPLYEDAKLERFEVVRHTAGGEPRNGL